MRIDPENRINELVLRSLESMKRDLEKFQIQLKGNVKNAKLANNVIDEPYYNISLDQVNSAFQSFEIYFKK